MKVLVTGTDGYIGSLLGHYLFRRGHEVVGLDTGYFRDSWLNDGENYPFPSQIRKDIRKILFEDIIGFEAVIHLAELSNDPLGQLNPATTLEINHAGSCQLARISKESGVERFVYSSSCSVYGRGTGGYKDENSKVNPQTAYAECKVLVERDVSELADDNFSPTFLRNATAYGASPRMRFDIVLNNLAGLAWTTREIKLLSDGTPWRPLIHVLDICEAMAQVLEAPREVVHNQIINIGSTEENYQIREIAEVVSEIFPACKLTVGSSSGDNRSYKVSFEKFLNMFPGHKCKWTIKHGAVQLREIFQKIGLDRETFESRTFTRMRQLQFLLETGMIDDHFFWKLPENAETTVTGAE